MITPSFSLTATERVLPKLALDFTTASLDPRVTFTRSGNTATVVNSSGYVTAINADLPRFDYNPVTLACNGLLIEEARTNLFTYSEDFGNASWVKSNATVSTNVVTSPSNVQNANKIVEAATTGVHFIEKVVSLTTGTAYTWSCFFKAAERSSVALIVFTNANHTGTFNLSTGTANTPSNCTSAITNMNNGWYRCSITFTSGATGNGFFDTYLSNGASTSYAGDGTSGLYIWGAQLEAGAFATSYIPTTTTALTRNADVATMTGTNFSSWWTATTGAVKTAVIPSTISGTRPLIQFDDNTATNQICLRGNSANPELYIKATTDQSQIDAGTIVANTAYKLSGAWNTNNCAAAQNGASPVTDSSATIPTVTQARIGSDGTNYANAWIQKISYWPQRLINAEVQAFSKI